MEPYFFQGVVLPERAQLSFEFNIRFVHSLSQKEADAKVSVDLNQVAVWVVTEDEWGIFDLRNVVKNIVQNHLAMIGFLKGYAYDLEITRVLNQSRNVDYVFGVEIPCLEERGKTIDLDKALADLRMKTVGKNGMYINRCFSDLVSAMKHADDTAFYCYRAIESLRHHCAAVHNNLASMDKGTQWTKFRDVSGSDESTIREIKESADPLRHGNVAAASSEDRETLFIKTWDVVDGYIKAINPSENINT